MIINLIKVFMERETKSVAKKTVMRKIKLPLVDLLEEKRKIDTFSNKNPFIIPGYIKANLKHKLRPYQNHALFNLDWTQHNSAADYKYNQLLFNMATGSGKTDVLAALILYCYTEFAYHNFLFVVNTNAVVAKTCDNLLNTASPKYLFSQPLTIHGQRIEIRSVTRFPNTPEDGVIYLRLTTIQTLTNELSETKENGLTYDDFKTQKLVILADEAHHFSAGTKSKEDQKERSWEYVLDRIRQANKHNRQFEFTATLDLQNEAIYQKYRQMIVYSYDLSSFIHDGYSKKVYRLQANNDDVNKMLNAVLLSQYRKRIAQELNIPNFKPVILFKSNKIAVSKKAREVFLDVISKLNITKLANFLKQNQNTSHSQALKQTYDYWLSQDLGTTIVELKRDFQAMNTINVNDSAKEGILGDLNDLHNLNTLESPDNPFRAIFAVAKLSEGWDVLNLYDIVRIGEQSTTINQTNSEAQLIGRGARYNPFYYQGKISYTRRFDNQNPKYQLLESLYYHTINDPKYLENLKKSLDKMNLPVEDDSDFDVFETHVKPIFKNSKVYKQGNFYYNEIQPVSDKEFNCLDRYGINTKTIAEVNLVNITWETDYNSDVTDIDSLTESRFLFKLRDALTLVKKAFSRNKFYRFNSLKHYIPNLNSLNEFIKDNSWLGNIRLYARVNNDSPALSRTQQLKAVEQYLVFVQNQIINNYQRQRGTKRFIPVPIKSVIKDYQKKIPKHFNKSVNALTIPYPMKNKSWFVFEDAIVDKLEKSLIDLIGSFVQRLSQKYDPIYLFRLDECNTNFKLHQFKGPTAHYDGFMPDFILYLQDKDFCYQIYIEPKGPQLLDKDQWKQDLLETIRPENIEIIGENQQIKLYGVKFFTYNDGRNIEQEMTELKIIK